MQLRDFEKTSEKIRKEHTFEVLGEIKSGKEATVYYASLDGQTVAMKVYREASVLKTKNLYLQGHFYKNKSEEKAIKSRNKFGRDQLEMNWISREFKILNKLYTLQASVPKPIYQVDNCLFMELIGVQGFPAPRLKDIEFTADQASSVFLDIVKNLKIFLQAGVVHGDLSEYNILWWQEKIWIIDFPQAIDVRLNKHKSEFLSRDLQNMVNYFSKYFPINLDELKALILS